MTAVELTSPFGPTRLSRQSAEDLAAVMKAVADPARLMILSVLLHRGTDGAHIEELVAALGFLAQPTISHHAQVLVAAGLVEREKVSSFVVLRLNRGRVAALASVLMPGGRS